MKNWIICSISKFVESSLKVFPISAAIKQTMEEEKKTSLSILNQYLFYYFAFNQQALTQMHLKITWISPTYYFGSIDLCYSKTWIIYVVLKDSFVPQWKLWEVSRSCLTLFSLLPPPLTICLEVVNLINFWFILPAWVCVYICMCFPSLFAQKEHCKDTPFPLHILLSNAASKPCHVIS